MKRIKSFKLFEGWHSSKDQMENVIQEIEDILISGGIKDSGYILEINDKSSLFSTTKTIEVYIYTDEEATTKYYLTVTNEIIEALERVVEYAKEEGFTSRICSYNSNINIRATEFNSISDLDNDEMYDTILLTLKKFPYNK